MSNLYKLITISNLSLEFDEPFEAKQMAKIKIKLYEDADANRCHMTKNNAEVENKTLVWNQSISFRLEAQTRFTFETQGEHQYGAQLEELQVLFKGVYYIKSQMLVKQDSCHVYSPEGQKKGVLKLQIQVVSREQDEVVKDQVQKEIPLVREDLIGLITINKARLEVISPTFNRKRFDYMDLEMSLDGKKRTFQADCDGQWPSIKAKLEYIEEGDKFIEFKLIHEGKTILDGNIECESIQKRKRYINHKVTMFNQNGIKMGFLILDLRYLAKQELLDLIYSPTNKLQYRQIQHTERSQSTEPAFPELIPSSTAALRKGISLKKHIFAKEAHLKQATPSRYKIGNQINRSSNIFIPQASRFQPARSNVKRMSFINPEKSSVFSSKGLPKEPSMSRGSKAVFLNSPGVGKYELPSIWSKY